MIKRSLPDAEPRHLPLSLEVQAREAFFLNYVTGTLKTWDFLNQFSGRSATPNHLRLSIDAVSLAYLSHQVYSEVGLVLARERYISALRQTNKALECKRYATDQTALLSSLLLDLYEKITNFEPQGYDQSWSSHVNGALALVKFRGLGNFQDAAELKVLARLSTNLLISCVASGTAVPADLIAVRAYCSKILNADDPKWRLSDLMVCYANIRSQVRKGELNLEDWLYLATGLDSRLQALTLEMPPGWRYKTTYIATAEIASTWGFRIDKYPNRHVTQTWNVCRLVRILLNESIFESCTLSSEELDTTISSLLPGRAAKVSIEILVEEICASSLQYFDCRYCRSAEPDFTHAVHTHTPAEKLDCYTLIFPLYVAGQSKHISINMRLWIIQQLRQMGVHFSICNAELVAQILERGGELDPWNVYAMLGSYAFVA